MNNQKDNKNLEDLITLGKSLARVEYLHDYIKTINNENEWYELYCVFLGLLYVSYETWVEAKFTNDMMNEFISDNSEFLLILRRFRNSIFHYEKEIISKRQIAFLANTKNISLAHQLLNHLKNSIYFFTIFNNIKSDEILKIQELLRNIIGWFPDNTVEIQKSKLNALSKYAVTILGNNIFNTKEGVELYISALHGRLLSEE